MTPAQREQIEAILNAGEDISIATNRADGYPQATVVSYVNDGLAIYFGAWSKSQKAQNMLRDNRVSLTITLPYAAWNEIKGLSLGGRATQVTDPAELQKTFALMVKKFPQVQQFVQGGDVEMAMFRVDPEVVSILDYAKSFGHTELVVIAA